MNLVSQIYYETALEKFALCSAYIPGPSVQRTLFPVLRMSVLGGQDLQQILNSCPLLILTLAIYCPVAKFIF